MRRLSSRRILVYGNERGKRAREEEETEREWHNWVYMIIFWHQTQSPFFYPNAVFWEIEIKKNKIWTLKKKHMFFTMLCQLLPTVFVSPSLKCDLPQQGTVASFLSESPQYTGVLKKSTLHWIRNSSSAGSTRWGFFPLLFFVCSFGGGCVCLVAPPPLFFSKQSQNKLKRKRRKKNQQEWKKFTFF